MLTCYQFFEPALIEEDFTHRVSLILLNQAYHQGFASYCLDEKLFDALNNTHLPQDLLEIKRVIPMGLLFLPPKLRNPDGQILKWVLFYHQLPEDTIATIQLKNFSLNIIPHRENALSWMTIFDDGCQYASSNSLHFERGNFADEENFFVNEILQYEGKNIDTKTEKEFGDKVTQLLIQTLLYLQINPQDQKRAGYPQLHHPAKGVSKKQKLTPIIIGRNYQVKTEKSSSRSVEPSARKSPITHWRRGHWRNQPYGARDNPQCKPLWIEPFLVNYE